MHEMRQWTVDVMNVAIVDEPALERPRDVLKDPLIAAQWCPRRAVERAQHPEERRKGDHHGDKKRPQQERNGKTTRSRDRSSSVRVHRAGAPPYQRGAQQRDRVGVRLPLDPIRRAPVEAALSLDLSRRWIVPAGGLEGRWHADGIKSRPRSVRLVRGAARFPPGFVGANVSTIPFTMTEPVRRLALPNQPAPELRARGFGEALSLARGKHLLIALRGHPDPDGIACALAQAHLGQRLGVAQTTIGYCHELSHRENRALVKLLGLELRKIKSVREVGTRRFSRARRRARGRSGAA